MSDFTANELMRLSHYFELAQGLPQMEPGKVLVPVMVEDCLLLATLLLEESNRLRRDRVRGKT